MSKQQVGIKRKWLRLNTCTQPNASNIKQDVSGKGKLYLPITSASAVDSRTKTVESKVMPLKKN